MLISKQWLRSFVKLPSDVTDEDVVKQLTASVVEVESMTDQSRAFDHMVLGRIQTVTPHPNADRLRVCQVDVGSRVVQIVCGGSNVAEGMSVAVALAGAKVRWHGEGELIELQNTSIRGEGSEGMICAGAEIGMGKPTDQEREIMDLSDVSARAGTPLAEVFGMNDVIMEVEHKSMTNRPDLFGHYGFAREIAALYRVPLAPYTPPKIRAGKSVHACVDIEDARLCARYMGVAIDGIAIVPSPEWMQRALRSCGINPINVIVDITNFILLELGQPMHAFDADCIGGEDIHLVVRQATAGETILALDDRGYTLSEGQIVIANEEKPLAIAGVMGGKESAVSEQTTRIFFEAATFAPASIRKTSQALGLRSESSARFEKALDPELCALALARAVELTLDLCPTARVVSSVVDEYPQKAKPVVFSIDPLWINARLGAEVSVHDMQDILFRLGFDVTKKGKLLSVTVPSWRATKDISLPEDVVEEILRIYGYDRIPSVLPDMSLAPPVHDGVRSLQRMIRSLLTQQFGATEVFTYAFASHETLTRLGFDPASHLKLANPLSEERPYLVRSLVPNVAEVVRKNQRAFDRVCVFQQDRVFFSDDEGETTGEEDSFLPWQPRSFAAVYAQKGVTEPFWVAKDIVVSVLKRAGFDAQWRVPVTAHAWQHPSRCADIWVQDTCVGTVAEIDPERADTFGLDLRTAACEIDLDTLATLVSSFARYVPMGTYQDVKRDLAFVVPDDVSFQSLEEACRRTSTLLESIELFDVYRGKGVEDGKKSLALHLRFRSLERTLEAGEVDEELNALRKMLEENFHAMMRA